MGLHRDFPKGPLVHPTRICPELVSCQSSVVYCVWPPCAAPQREIVIREEHTCVLGLENVAQTLNRGHETEVVQFEHDLKPRNGPYER